MARLPDEEFSGLAQDPLPKVIILPDEPTDWEKSNHPVCVLFRMGLEAIPALADALDDCTRTKCVRCYFVVAPGSPMRLIEKTTYYNLNEVASILIGRIAEREFLPDRPAIAVHVGHQIPQGERGPEQMLQLKNAVLEWYAKNGKNTLAERKIADVNGDNYSNRRAAIRWIGEHKEESGREALARRAEALLLLDNRDSLANRELSACALALGQLGNRAEVGRVRRICQHILVRQWEGSMQRLRDLFDAYHALAMLGEKEEAVREFNGVYDTWRSGRELSEGDTKRYQDLLDSARTW